MQREQSFDDALHGLYKDNRVELFEGKANSMGKNTPARRSWNGAIKQAPAPAELAPWRSAGAK